jgi:hypothetical protein
MLLLRWLWIGNGNDGEIPPIAVFWALRVLMFIVGFVLEDWAIHELIQSQRQRRIAVLLVASSYVTWTYQTHTFSNSIETLVVAWCLVLIERIVGNPVGARPGDWYMEVGVADQRDTAAEFSSCFNSPRDRRRFRGLQQDYFPSFFANTRASASALLLEKVRQLISS